MSSCGVRGRWEPSAMTIYMSFFKTPASRRRFNIGGNISAVGVGREISSMMTATVCPGLASASRGGWLWGGKVCVPSILECQQLAAVHWAPRFRPAGDPEDQSSAHCHHRACEWLPSGAPGVACFKFKSLKFLG